MDGSKMWRKFRTVKADSNKRSRLGVCLSALWLGGGLLGLGVLGVAPVCGQNLWKRVFVSPSAQPTPQYVSPKTGGAKGGHSFFNHKRYDEGTG